MPESLPMVYDCILYNGEDLMLEIRFHELHSIVDRFIICEGDHTFSGIKKEYKFDIHKFKSMADKNCLLAISRPIPCRHRNMGA